MREDLPFRDLEKKVSELQEPLKEMLSSLHVKPVPLRPYGFRKEVSVQWNNSDSPPWTGERGIQGDY